MNQTISIMLRATFDTKMRRLLDAYPAIYLACHRRHIRDDETGAFVTAHQASILDHLDLQKPTTISTMAEHLGIGRSAMSIQVNNLVRKGYIRRRPMPGDRRKTGLTLTDTGNKIKKQNTVLDPERLKALFALMPDSELERALQGIERLAKYATMLTTRSAEQSKMKIILIGMCVLLGLTLAVIVVGMALPKAHIASRSAVFRSAPEILFAIIDGPQTWRSNVKKYEAVASQNGRRRWRETDAHGHTIAYEAIERQPPSLLKTQIITANLPYSGRWTFKLNPINGSTLLRITEEGEVYNPVFRFMSRFVIGRTRTMDTYLRDLGATTGQQVEIRN